MLFSQETVLNILFTSFGPLLPNQQFQFRVIVSDEKYLSLEVADVVQSILSDPILAPARYARNIFDCDDYVLYLKSKLGLFAQTKRLEAPLALGYLLTRRHAFNFCIDSQSILHVVNTQSDDKGVSSDPATFPTFLRLTQTNFIQTIYI